MQYDVELTDATETATTRLATAQILAEYSQNNPGSIPPDLLMEYANVPFSVKQKIRKYNEQRMKAEQLAADREFELRKEELAIKRLSAQAQISQVYAKHKEWNDEFTLS